MSDGTFDAMMAKVVKADGFLAALDQSGGSTPKALKAYGIPDDVRIQRPTEAVQLSGQHLTIVSSSRIV